MPRTRNPRREPSRSRASEADQERLAAARAALEEGEASGFDDSYSLEGVLREARKAVERRQPPSGDATR